MKSSIEPQEGNKVKISVTIEADEFESAIDEAWKAIAKEVRIPGFRPGKAPRKVLEARIEPGYARSEAINKAVPEYYYKAVRLHEVDAIAQPDLEVTGGEEDGDVTFDAVVEVRPEITLSGYESLTVEIPSPNPSDDDVTEQIDRLRAQYGDLAAVERPVAEKDYVTIDIEGRDGDEVVESLTAEGYSYLVGSGVVVPELDTNLVGASAGDTVTFTAAHPREEDRTIEFTVKVGEVKEQVLPELTDEWVSDATEFETVADFRDDVVNRLTTVRKAQASVAVQNGIGEKLAELVTEDVPEALLNAEMRARLENLVGRLQQQGLSLDTYLQVTGTDPATFTEDLRNDSTVAIKVDLALRAVARQEGLEATEDEVEEEIEKVAAQVGLDIDEVRERLDAADQIVAIRSEIGRRNALRWLTERVDIVDENGNAVDRDALDLDFDEDEDDHDHGHDHDHDH